MNEVWLPVSDYCGLYEVSNTGKIRSLDRVVNIQKHTKKIKGKILSAGNADGYRNVVLSKDGKGKTRFIHRLVAMAFLGQPLPGQEVNHKDEDRANNHVQNLEWVFHRENLHHTWNRSPHKKAHWSTSGSNKLTPREVLRIREIGRSMKQKDIAKMFNVSRQTISNILTGRSFVGLHND